MNKHVVRNAPLLQNENDNSLENYSDSSNGVKRSKSGQKSIKQVLKLWNRQGSKINNSEAEYKPRYQPIHTNKSLQVLLKDPIFYKEFYKFLEHEWSDENLEFWDKVEQLKMQDFKLKTQDSIKALNEEVYQTISPFAKEENEKKNELKHEETVEIEHNSEYNTQITEIFDTFLKVGGEREVNLDDLTRKSIKSSIDLCINQNKIIGVEILLPAQERICNLMLRDSYPRFRSIVNSSD